MDFHLTISGNFLPLLALIFAGLTSRRRRK